MSDLELLFLVFSLLYVLQCISWIGPDSFAFRTLWNRRWKLLPGKMHPGTWARRAVLVNPLPPLGGLLVCEALPVCLSREGACHDASASGTAQSISSLRFDDIPKVASVRKFVRADDRAFLKTHSEVYARHLARLLDRLRRSPPGQRDAVIEHELAQMLDADRVEQRLSEYHRQSFPLRLSCNMLFFSLFLVIPTVVRHWGLLVTWRFLLVYCVVQLGLTALCFHRAHRELYPEEGESRWTLVVTVFLSPPMAIRATDALMRDILCDIHPLAAARVLCNEEEFLALASRILREVEFPLPASDVSQENPTREWEEAYREKLWRALERFMARAGKNLHHLLGPPRRESEECKSYCPRCWNQYLIPSGVCLDCQGLPLRSFSDVSTAKPQPS